MEYQDQLSLDPHHSLVHKGSRTKGFMEETDIDSYDVLDPAGAKVGEVEVQDHTAVKGFARTIRLIHRDAAGKTVLDRSFKRRKQDSSRP